MKKINERFDDYMQKYFHEDTPLEDILSGEQMIGSNDIGRSILGFQAIIRLCSR